MPQPLLPFTIKQGEQLPLNRSVNTNMLATSDCGHSMRIGDAAGLYQSSLDKSVFSMIDLTCLLEETGSFKHLKATCTAELKSDTLSVFH